jgi:hypothetical protein
MIEEKNGLVDRDKLQIALTVGRRMANEYMSYGAYRPSECWGSEGQIYPALMGLALLDLYKVEKEPILLEGVRAVIESVIKKQTADGGWALNLGENGSGLKFKVSKEISELISLGEDLPPTVTSIRLMAEYFMLTQDETYQQNLNLAYNFLVKFWNDDKGEFSEMLHEEGLKLRANPKSYHLYVYQCILSVQKIFPEASVYLDPLYKSVKETFESFDSYTYPLLYGLHAAQIIAIEGASTYVKTVVKDRIEQDIAINSKFLIKEMPGALGHRDGIRGVCLDEGHVRNSIGAALVMKFYDHYVEPGSYLNTALYADLSKWIFTMYEKDRFFEFVELNDGVRKGVGSSGQYLPINWILGKF